LCSKKKRCHSHIGLHLPPASFNAHAGQLLCLSLHGLTAAPTLSEYTSSLLCSLVAWRKSPSPSTFLCAALDGNDTRAINELHSLSSGVKAAATWHTNGKRRSSPCSIPRQRRLTRSFSAVALQVCRECCGGQGYAAYNRFSQLRNDHDIFQTFEGDNTVLMQQVAKDILSQHQKQFKGKPYSGE